MTVRSLVYHTVFVSAEKRSRNKGSISERQNTVVCSFDPKSPGITALDIHEWIFEQLHVPENVVTMVQLEGTCRQVYIKFTDFQYLQDLLHSTTGQSEYKHENGEISQVNIEMAGIGTRRVMLANLPPETPDETVSFAFSQYGKINEMQRQIWSKTYRYKVFDGVRIAVITLTKHIPSHVMVAGHRSRKSEVGEWWRITLNQSRR